MELPEVPPPFISSAPGLANLRDIGGYPITDHTSVRKGLVYRGPDPAPVSATSLETLHSLGITTLFDLRSQQQIDRAGGHRDLYGIHRIWSPVFGPEEYTPEKAALRYAQYSAPGTKVLSHCVLTSVLWNMRVTFSKSDIVIGYCRCFYGYLDEWH